MDAVATARHVAAGALVGVAAATAGYVAVRVAGTHDASRMLPWILGRGLGWAAYLCLTALTCLGLWLRHPWRRRWRFPEAEAQLRVHARLAAATGVLLAAHVVALVLDRYARVGWFGAAIPGASGYRPFAVALGTAATYLGLLVGLTAALAGRLVRARWLPVHRLATPVFVLACLHGILAGSDTTRTALVYLGTAAIVALLSTTRYVADSGALRAYGERR